MQAIVTKYLGPTNTRDARIKATAYAGSVTIAYDHALDSPENHEQAAFALAYKLGWVASEESNGLLEFRATYAQVCVARARQSALLDCR